MIDISRGRYWDKPWSLVDGCTPCSPGCDHCWSAVMTKRFHPYEIEGDMVMPFISDNGRSFIGRIRTRSERLSIPERTRKPTVFAVWNDWAHEHVDHIFRAKMVKIAKQCPQHTFLALTKRPENIVRLLDGGRISPSLQGIHGILPNNWWSGLTVCDQSEADAKIPVFLQVPGKKFLSIEPMLGAIDFSYNHFCGIMGWGPPDPPRIGENGGDRLKRQSQWVLGKIDAVILGGETGPGARPMHPDWVRYVRDQCASARVPFFFKQWGEWSPPDQSAKHRFVSAKAYNCHVWEDLTTSWRYGRKHAGRMLDGITHNELPWRKTEWFA